MSMQIDGGSCDVAARFVAANRGVNERLVPQTPL
jgi:hypothetical protein